MALAVGATGEVYVAGGTNSTDFKGTASDGGVGSALQGPSDGFVARLSSSGKSLDWLLFVGGTREDELMNMLQGPSGELFVIGQTKSEDLPARVGALDPLNGWEGFAAHINPSVPGTAWSAYIQGPDDQAMSDLAFDPGSSGILYVTGTRLQGTAAQDAFLGTISGATSGATRLQSLIPVGGSGRDEGHALVLAPSEVQVWGTTWSNDFPMAGASQAGDVFVAVFPEWLSNPSMPLEKAALFGGPEDDELRSATMDSAGHIYVGGVTTSRRFPVPGGFDTDMGSGDFVDGFVARVRLDAKPASVEWGSFVGGSQYDEVLVVRADNQEPDRLFIGGYTGSDDLRYSPSGYNPKQSNGGYDMFLLSVDVKALPDGGTAEPDAGSEVPDAGPGEPDAGTGQPDAGAGAPDAGTEGPRSPLGWSCGATDGRGGPGALSVVMLTGLGLFVSRRQRQEGSVITIPGRR